MQGIAAIVGTKSVPECGVYLHRLAAAARCKSECLSCDVLGLSFSLLFLSRFNLSTRATQILEPEPVKNLPVAAYEVSDAWIAFEEREAARLQYEIEMNEFVDGIEFEDKVEKVCGKRKNVAMDVEEPAEEPAGKKKKKETKKKMEERVLEVFRKENLARLTQK